MALQSATFNKNSVVEFLNIEYPYAAEVFAQDHPAEDIQSEKVAQWFRLHFPVGKGAALFKELECTCVQYMRQS